MGCATSPITSNAPTNVDCPSPHAPPHIQNLGLGCWYSRWAMPFPHDDHWRRCRNDRNDARSTTDVKNARYSPLYPNCTEWAIPWAPRDACWQPDAPTSCTTVRYQCRDGEDSRWGGIRHSGRPRWWWGCPTTPGWQQRRVLVRQWYWFCSRSTIPYRKFSLM